MASSSLDNSTATTLIVPHEEEEDELNQHDNNNNNISIQNLSTASCNSTMSTTVISSSSSCSTHLSYKSRTTTADDIIAEAFLRCARIRTCFTVWRSKSYERAECYQISQQVADTFRDKYLAWKTLQSWKRKAEEQNRMSEMSLVAWSWQARRSKRRVLNGWRRYCDEIVVKRARIREELDCIRYVAEQQMRLQTLYTWMALASRGQVANTFYKYKMQKHVVSKVFDKWRNAFIKKQLLKLQVTHLQSRIQLQNSLRCFNMWFLGVFAARRKQLLDSEARLDSQAALVHRRHLLTTCFSRKWVIRKNQKIASRYYRQMTLSKIFYHLTQQYQRHSSLRLLCEQYQNNKNCTSLSRNFRAWQYRTSLQQSFATVSSSHNKNTLSSCLQKWKQRVEESKEEKQWNQVSSQIRTNLVLKKGFETLVHSSVAMMKFNQQQLQRNNHSQNNNNNNHRTEQSHHHYFDPTSSLTHREEDHRHQQQEEHLIESRIRSLLSSFRNLMLTNEADQAIIADRELHESTSSVKRNALVRQKERERLRNSIVQLRTELVNLRK